MAVDVASIMETVDPSEVPTRASGQRVRTSAPILDTFVKSGDLVQRIPTAKLEAEPKEIKVRDADGNETGETVMETQDQANTRRSNSLLSSLALYAQNNRYPVEVFSRAGDVFLRRYDLDDEGEPIPGWTPKEPKQRADSDGDVEVEVEGEYAGAEAES
jgi:hypothetical protein